MYGSNSIYCDSQISTLGRVLRIIISIWVVAFIVAVPYAVHTKLYHVVYTKAGAPIPDSLICNIPDIMPIMYYMFQISTFLFFITPVTIIIILYVFIGMALRRSALHRGASDDRTNSVRSCSTLPHQSRRSVVRMLGECVSVFVLGLSL